MGSCVRRLAVAGGPAGGAGGGGGGAVDGVCRYNISVMEATSRLSPRPMAQQAYMLSDQQLMSKTGASPASFAGVQAGQLRF